jgi:hypothetical protein
MPLNFPRAMPWQIYQAYLQGPSALFRLFEDTFGRQSLCGPPDLDEQERTIDALSDHIGRLQARHFTAAAPSCERVPKSTSRGSATRGWRSRRGRVPARVERLYSELDPLTGLRPEARQALLAECRRHLASKVLLGVPTLGVVRVAQLIAAAVTPHRCRSKR